MDCDPISTTRSLPGRSKMRGVSPYLVTFLLFSLVKLMQISKANAALDPEEEIALETLRNGINLPNWTGDPCNSAWITCSNSTKSEPIQNVLELNLGSSQLTGNIPPDIAKLRQLRLLHFTNNALSGPIPNMSNMTSLSKLLLGENKLTGGIPASLFQQKSLAQISLYENPLGGPLPDLSRLINLDSLDLHNTGLNGSIPDSIQKLYRLTYINVKHCRLEGPIPDLTMLVVLQQFEGSFNNFSGSLPGVKNARGLINLSLAQNNIRGPIPSALFQHSTLRWLYFSNNSEMSGEIPDMSQLRNLETFWAEGCNLVGPIPSLENNTNLQELVLPNNRLSAFPSDLRNIASLQLLVVHGNIISGQLPSLPTGSSQSSQLGLKKIDFSRNNFYGEIPKAWGNLSYIEYMSVAGNQLNGDVPKELGSLRKLQNLDISSNSFTGVVPEEFGLLESLQTLNLRNNRFSGVVPESLAKLPKLQTLYLDNNNFTGIPAALASKVNLTYTPLNLKIIHTNSSRGLSSGGIVGAVAGALVVTIAILAIVLLLTRRKRKHEDRLSKEDMPKSAQAFSLKQIKLITGNFKRLVGKGGFGPVYYGKLPNSKEVAVKVRATDSKQGAGEFLNEVRLLSRLHHRNLVPLVGYCREAQQQILIYNFMSQGTLEDHLYNYHKGTSTEHATENGARRSLDWKTRLDIAIKSARGLEYLHKDCHPPVIHRDVKSSNILLTEKLGAKVGDLGISKQAPELDPEEAQNLTGVTTGIKGTLGYLDPEYFSRHKLTAKSDVYSFGMVLLEIVTGKRPQSQKFPGSTETNLKVKSAVRENQLELIVDPALNDGYSTDSMLIVVKTALSCVLPEGPDRPDMGDIVHSLIEALNIENECLQSPQNTDEMVIPLSGQLRNPSSSTWLSPSSREANDHASWNTDPG